MCDESSIDIIICVWWYNYLEFLDRGQQIVVILQIQIDWNWVGIFQFINYPLNLDKFLTQPIWIFG